METRGSQYAGFFCPKPFETAYIDFAGEVHLCLCPEFLPTTVGNIAESSFEEVWNSDAARDIRGSILDGSYRYCDDGTCPFLKSGTLKKLDEVTDPIHQKIIAEGITSVPERPKEIIAAYDPSCNLSCPACRESTIVFKGNALTKSQKIHDVVVNEVLSKDTEAMTLAGNGEPFFSQLFRSMLEELDQSRSPKLKISLITHGLLLTPAMWKRVKASHGAIDRIGVSVNAATAETYKVVQRGADFARLLVNLDFIKTLRQDGSLPTLYLNFYVQQNNYKEMKDFIQMGRTYGVDQINFQVLLWAAHVAEEEFLRNAVHLDGHPDHDDFLETMKDPIFLDPIVSLGNLAPFLPQRSPVGGDVSASSIRTRLLQYVPENVQ